MDKKAGVRFDENLHIEFIYNPESDSVVVYRNGEIISDSYITPEQLETILEDYVTLDDMATDESNGLMSSSDKSKLDGIASGAEVNVQSDWDEADSSKDAYIKNKPSNATTSKSGLMSSTDKSKLNGIASGAEVNVQSDWSEADSSSDAYIKNKPTLPTNVSDLVNDSGFIGNGNGAHSISFINSSTYVTLQIMKGSDYTSLVFYDTGKVAIERYAGGQWKAGAVLRNAD